MWHWALWYYRQNLSAPNQQTLQLNGVSLHAFPVLFPESRGLFQPCVLPRFDFPESSGHPFGAYPWCCQENFYKFFRLAFTRIIAGYSKHIDIIMVAVMNDVSGID